MKTRNRLCTWYPGLTIDPPLKQLGGKHIGAVDHAKWSENPGLHELPERLSADAPNDVAQQIEAKVRVQHGAAGPIGQRGTNGQPDPVGDRGMLSSCSCGH